METVRSFEDLECWKVCTDLRRFVGTLVKTFPANEKYQLVSQMIRASRSSTNNIAEGYGRFHFKENAQFCRQSRGSLYELNDHFIIALDDNYISKQMYQEGIAKYEKCILLLDGYIKYLVNAEKTKNVPPPLTNNL